MTLTAEKKIGLINKWAEIFYNNTSTLYADAGDLGGQIAYLYHAIVENGVIELNPDADLLELLKGIDYLTAEDRSEIMGYIQLTCPYCANLIESGKPHFIDWPDGRHECQGSIEANA